MEKASQSVGPKARKAFRQKAAGSAAEAELELWIRSHPQIARPIREYSFHPSRKWRFDFAWPQRLFAIEIEGLGGRHQTTPGFLGDLEKYFEAFMLGWRIVRVSSAMVKDGRAIRAILRGLEP